MYEHQKKPRQWEDLPPAPEVMPPRWQQLGVADHDDDNADRLLGCSLIALPVFAIAFSLGYMSGVWGWI